MPVPVPTILSDGKPLDATCELLSLEVNKEINRIPDARLVALDGSHAARTFALSETGFFEPGKTIEIKMRYEGEKDATLFKGAVVRHGIEAREAGSRLTVELKDAAVGMTHARRSEVYLDKSDDEIIAGLIERAGLAAGTLARTKPRHAELIQYYATDWDFMLSRADVQGLVVAVDDGRVSLRTMELAGAANKTFEYGLGSIDEIELEIDGGQQYAALESVAWDIKKQALTSPRKAREARPVQGNLEGKKIATALGFSAYTLSHPVPAAPDELQAWADARMARSRLSLITGRISTGGVSDIGLLDVVQLGGLGARFNGKALVTGIRHRLDHDGWRTELRLGLSGEWFCHREAIAETPAAGLLPPVNGLQIGVVDNFIADPDKEFRVKVLLPGIDPKKGAVWARLASPDAGKDRGFLFWPEKGDEVVVGFFANDPRQPVILGSMFSSVNTPPAAVGQPAESNQRKAIVTKKGTAITFLDADQARVSIATAGKNQLVIDDDAQSIALSDQHGNTITMDKDGITLKSAKDFKIDAGGKVEIKGSKVDVK